MARVFASYVLFAVNFVHILGLPHQDRHCQPTLVTEELEVCVPYPASGVETVKRRVLRPKDTEYCFKRKRPVCKEAEVTSPAREICTETYESEGRIEWGSNFELDPTESKTEQVPFLTCLGSEGVNATCDHIAYDVPRPRLTDVHVEVAAPRPAEECVTMAPVTVVQVVCEEIEEEKCFETTAFEHEDVELEATASGIEDPFCKIGELSLPSEVCSSPGGKTTTTTTTTERPRIRRY